MKAKILAVVVLLALAGAAVLVYNRQTTLPSTTLTTPPASTRATAEKATSLIGRVKVPANGCYLGSYIDGTPPINTQQIRAFEQMIGKRLAIVCLNYVAQDGSSGQTTFPRRDLESILETGSIPMLGWYPILKDMSGKALPTRSQDIIDGRLDALVRDWASNMRQLAYPIFLRLGWEMNLKQGYWSGTHSFGPRGDQTWNNVDKLYTYFGDPKKPDGPERYVESWKHVRAIFCEEGATNVVWIWCPHHRSDPDVEWNSPENYYPGDEHVDWVGFDLYNGGYVRSDSRGQFLLSFDEIFIIFIRYHGPELYKQHQNKPIILAEVGCLQTMPANVIGDKAAWIADAYNSIRNLYPNIKAVCWFSKDKRHVPGEADWRVDSSPESLEAYKKAISDPYFLDRIMFEAGGQAPPSAIPLQTGMIAIPLRPTTGRRLSG